MSRGRRNWEDSPAAARDVPNDQLNDMYHIVNQLSVTQLMELAEYVVRRIRMATRHMFGGVKCGINCSRCEEASQINPIYRVQKCQHVSYTYEDETYHQWHQQHLCWFHGD